MCIAEVANTADNFVFVVSSKHSTWIKYIMGDIACPVCGQTCMASHFKLVRFVLEKHDLNFSFET